MTQNKLKITVGVLALQGAFSEHLQLLRRAFAAAEDGKISWTCTEVRTVEQLSDCDALIIPGGESTTIALVAARSGLLEPLRTFVKVSRKPVWGTCAGMVLLAETANRTKKGGQELIGGLDVRVHRNFYGRQTESFEADIDLPFLSAVEGSKKPRPYRGVFIRAPVVEKILPAKKGIQVEEAQKPENIVAPSRNADDDAAPEFVGADVEVLATLPSRQRLANVADERSLPEDDIIAIRQGNVFATSFHPELTEDFRIHLWWLGQIRSPLLVSK